MKLPLLWLVSSLLPIILLAAGEVEAVDPGKVHLSSPVGEQQSGGESVTASPQRVSPARVISSLPAARTAGDPDTRGDFSLRLSTRLSTHLLHRTTDDKRAMRRVENELEATLYAQARQQLAVAAELRHIEAALAQLRERTERQTRSGEQTRIAVPRNAVLTASLAQSGQTQGPLSPPLPPIDVESTADKSDWWLEMVSLLGLISFLAWIFRRRAGTPSPLPLVAVPAGASGETNHDTGHKSPEGGADPSLVVGDGVPLAEALQAQTQTTGLVPPKSIVSPVKGNAGELTKVLELAEMMFAAGRIEAAAPALAEFVECHPLAAVTPWLTLLKIYRKTEQRDAFEALGRELRRYFNVAPPDWGAVADTVGTGVSLDDDELASLEYLLPRLPTIEQLPHLVNEISRTWGSPACLAYLNKLLRDNRDGERRGFSLSTVDELLILIDLLETRLSRTR